MLFSPFWSVLGVRFSPFWSFLCVLLSPFWSFLCVLFSPFWSFLWCAVFAFVVFCGWWCLPVLCSCLALVSFGFVSLFLFGVVGFYLWPVFVPFCSFVSLCRPLLVCCFRLCRFLWVVVFARSVSLSCPCVLWFCLLVPFWRRWFLSLAGVLPFLFFCFASFCRLFSSRSGHGRT